MNKCFNNFAGKKFCVVTIFSTETVRTAVIAQNMTSYSRKMVMYNNWDQLTWQRQGRTAMIELKANSCSVQQTAIVFQIFCANFLCKSSLIYSRVLVLRKRSTTHYVLVCIGGQLLESRAYFHKVPRNFDSEGILVGDVAVWGVWVVARRGQRQRRHLPSVSKSTLCLHLHIFTEEDQTWYLF